MEENIVKNATGRRKKTLNNENDITHNYRKKDEFLEEIDTTVKDVVDLNAEDIRHKLK